MINVELLLKVKEHILNYPENVDMSTSISGCRTTGCIAGWTVLLGNPDATFAMKTITTNYTPNEVQYEWCDVEQVAQNLLGIDEDSGASSLFFYDEWPKVLQDEYLRILTGLDDPDSPYFYIHEEELSKLNSEQRQQLAQVIGKAIDYYIEHYGDR